MPDPACRWCRGVGYLMAEDLATPTDPEDPPHHETVNCYVCNPYGTSAPLTDEEMQQLVDSQNGMLPQIPGQYIAEAAAQLPPAATATDDNVTVQIDTTTTWHGPVKVRFKRSQHRHGKSTFWSWTAVRADPVA